MKSGSKAEYSSGHMWPQYGESLVYPPPMTPCTQPCASSSEEVKREKLLDRKATPVWAIRLFDWFLKASENSDGCDGAHGSSDAGHRTVELIFRHCEDGQSRRGSQSLYLPFRQNPLVTAGICMNTVGCSAPLACPPYPSPW